MAPLDLSYEAERTLKRITPRILEKIHTVAESGAAAEVLEQTMENRLQQHWPRLFRLLHQLYGTHYDFFYYLENILLAAVDSWLERPETLKQLDRRRENHPEWYLSEHMVGGSCYVDLFGSSLNDIREKIPYFKDLGLTYLHLMPLFASREGQNDGGYAISDYRQVDPDLGTVEDLRALANDLRVAGISLALDFVFNHTSDEHRWAVRAQEGDREHSDYYHIYEDRQIPDQYEQHLREIFPTVRRGNFTWHEGMHSWVWTTFNSYQWDLKYSNPEVFRAMVTEMLFLANTGVEILRLDAVAFIWKQMGTNCENLPEAHLLIQAFNAVCRIAAPGLVFKSEAIVHPDEVVKYISPQECQISYNPTLMSLLWESLATRNTKLLKQSLSHRHGLPDGTTWVNYLRCHDDIGWSFDDEDAWAVGINPQDHRQFLNQFYTGNFPGSFACGVPFQHNEDTGDMRISGTMASLAGLEQAIKKGDKLAIQFAIRRMRMLYGVLCSIGGVPLIFLGEEWGTLNDYDYLDSEEKANDSRWVHRTRMNWEYLEEAGGEDPVHRKVFKVVQEIFLTRQKLAAFTGNTTKLLHTGNEHVLGYLRSHDSNHVLVLANFSEASQIVDTTTFYDGILPHFLKDVFGGELMSLYDPLEVSPYDFKWLKNED
ncbi:MAG: alpha-amylase family glycosyl hydrolase [Verrucomicrobiota bacterium]